MGNQERVTVDAQDKLRKLKEAGREYFAKQENRASPEIRRVICNANGFLELLYYSKKFPDNRDWLRARIFELARRRLSPDQIKEASKLAEEIYNDHNKLKEKPPTTSITTPKTENTSRTPQKASISTDGLNPDVVDQSANRYFNSPQRESLKRNLGERRYDSLREKVERFINQGHITQKECGEFSLQNITRIGRAIVNQAQGGNPTAFQPPFLKPPTKLS